MSQIKVEIAPNIKEQEPFVSQEQQVKQKFIFDPSETVDQLLTNFKERIEKGLWNGYITFKNFKGTFKLEYWANIEEQFRQINGIIGFTFKNTKLDKKHLIILRSLLQWVQPKEVSLSFKRNELDDLDLEDFLLKWLLPNFHGNIRSLKVISNPGIFKGHFLSLLKQKLAIMTLKDQSYYFHFIKNKEYKSIGFMSCIKGPSHLLFDANIDIKKLKFEKSLQQTCYYQLSLKECFTKQNEQSLLYFIEQAYHEDQLECIESLDVGECDLGSEINFINLSKKISTSKGLLSLGLRKQVHIHSQQLLLPLMGDRYDQLRINHLNIEENDKITTLSVKILSNNLISKCLKKIDFGDLSQDDEYLYQKISGDLDLDDDSNMVTKILYITNAFFKQIKEFEKIMKKDTKTNLEQIIPKLNLKKIDLSKIDTLNSIKQPQSARALLESMVLNQFSSCKELITQNVYDSQLKVQLDSLNQFEADMALMKKQYPIYLNYIPKLISIKSSFVELTYPIETKLMIELMERFYFTKTTNLIKIKTLSFERILILKDSGAGFLQFLESLSNVNGQDENVQYTLEHLTVVLNIDSEVGMHQSIIKPIFKNIVFSKKFKLESLILENEKTTNNDWKEIINFGQNFLLQNRFCSLRNLQFSKLNAGVDLIKLIDLLVFNEILQLQELILIDIETKYDLESVQSIKSLKKKGNEWKNQQSIQKLHLIRINKKIYNGQDHILKTLMELLIIHQTSSVNELVLQELEFRNFLEDFQNQIEKQLLLGHKPMINLKTVKLGQGGYREIFNTKQWVALADIFLFGNHTNITSLELSNFSDMTSSGIKQSYNKKIKYLEKINECIRNSLSTIILNECHLDGETLSLLLLEINADIKILHLINCTDIDKDIQHFKKVYAQKPKNYQSQIEELVLDGNNIDVRLFQWFLGVIILNKETQKLKNLTIKNCKLDDSHFDIINNILAELIEYQLQNKLKGYFKFKKFDFDKNNEISHQQWTRFFDNIILINNLEDAFQKEYVQISQINFERISQINIEFLKDSNETSKSNKQKCCEIAEFIVVERLKIPQKMLNKQKLESIYKITPPKQLLRLELDMVFANQGVYAAQERFYISILRGLVYFHGSQLMELKLENINIVIFTESTEKIFFDHKDLISLKLLKLHHLKHHDDFQGSISLKKFLKLYLSNLQINLEALIIISEVLQADQFLGDISDSIQYGLDQGKSYALKKLKCQFICRGEGQDTQEFLKTVVFSIHIPLQTLKIDKGFNLKCLENNKDCLCQMIKDHLERQNHNCTLKKLTIINNAYDSEEVLRQIFLLLIDGNYVRLIKLKLVRFNLTDIIQKGFSQQQLINFTIQELNLGLNKEMNMEIFKFLYNIKPKLSVLKLKLNVLLLNAQNISDFLKIQSESERYLQTQKPCKLYLTFEMSNEEIKNEVLETGEDLGQNLMNYFVFGDVFKWSQVSLKIPSYFDLFKKSLFDDCFIDKLNLKRYLRCLKIDYYFIMDSLQQLSDTSLKLLGHELIYDEKSILEELCLDQCDLRITSLKALTYGAEDFRERIKNCQKQQSTCLNLKRLSIQCSSNIGEEGADYINTNILFFEYITIERIDVQGTQWNSEMMMAQCQVASTWLQFQKFNNRESQHFLINYVDWSNNYFVQSEEAWFQLCDTFLFSQNAPMIQIIKINQMNLEEKHFNWICKKADDYFSRQPKDYTHPLKHLILSGEPIVSAESWKKLSERFFFSQYIELEQLDLQQTTLESDDKVDAIYKAGAFRASKRQTGKLTLNTFLTNNVSLKSSFIDIMSDELHNYKSLKNYSGNCQLPNTIGEEISMTTKSIYEKKFISTYFKRGQTLNLRFSEYHLDIVSGLLQPLNQLLDINKEYDCEFVIDLTVCDELCNIFKYNQAQGDPYPYRLLFSPEACLFYQQPSSKIRVINFIQTDTKNADQVDQLQVLQLWESVKSRQSSLDIVYLKYRLDDDLADAMLQIGYNERDIVNLVRLFPPSSIRLQVTLSLSALKAIYTIMYDNYQFNYSNILFDKDLFINVGVGYALRESVYRMNPKGYISKLVKNSLYTFFNIFVTPVPKYRFSNEIKKLNEFLCTQRIFLMVLILSTIIYYVICLFGPYGWQRFFEQNDDTKQICFDQNKNTSKGVYMYLSFAFVSFLVESFLYKQVIELIPKHIYNFMGDDLVEAKLVELNNLRQNSPKSPNKELESPDELVEEKSSLVKQDSQTKKSKNKVSIIDKSKGLALANLKRLAQSKRGIILGYMINLVLSQLAKLNLYTEVTFILLTFYCEYYFIALFGLISTAFIVYFQLYNLIIIIIKQFTRDKSTTKLLSTLQINEFYEISTIGRNIALTTIFDQVSPFNVTVISNNLITQSLATRIAGKSMSNSVRAYGFKFIFGDFPHIILQLYFIISIGYHPIKDPHSDKTLGELSPTLFLTVINTGISILLSFYKLMSIRPSYLSQIDFDELALEKTKKFLNQERLLIQKESKIIHALTNN